MKLNRKWLNEEFVDLSHISDKEYVETLTVFGQKVETWERMDAEIKNVVVGKVIDIVRHENSDHMWVCQIEVGEEEPVQIVTGAQNVKVGDMVRIKDGAFLGCEGKVMAIDETRGRLTVEILLFGRTTPADLEFWQVEAAV